MYSCTVISKTYNLNENNDIIKQNFKDVMQYLHKSRNDNIKDREQITLV